MIAKAADMTDRKGLGRRVHRQVSMLDTVDPGRGHDGARSGAIERNRQFGLPPQQREQDNGEPGAIRSQHRKNELDRVGELNSDNGIVRQSGFDEMRRQRRDRAIGFGVGQAFWRLAGDALFVDGIEQRQRIRSSGEGSSKQYIERRRYVGRNHGITSLLGPAFATRFPADSRSTRWLPAVLSDSSAQSIALAR